MSEAEEGFAKLNDVDEGTFVRFSQWACKGYYPAANFTLVDAANAEAVLSPASELPNTPREILVEAPSEWNGSYDDDKALCEYEW